FRPRRAIAPPGTPPVGSRGGVPSQERGKGLPSADHSPPLPLALHLPVLRPPSARGRQPLLPEWRRTLADFGQLLRHEIGAAASRLPEGTIVSLSWRRRPKAKRLPAALADLRRPAKFRP